ncbi:MAG: hypothetical protein IJ371_04460 [Clostridia bacterium]|nr:hypothetical protein [Clostridia bacterium]
MQKFKMIFSPRKMIIWVSLLVLVISFQYTNQPAQSQTQAIVTALAIDKTNENMIEVSAVILTPVQGSSTKRKTYSAEGIDITTAINNISLQLGKQIGFGQCDIMAIGDNLCEENAMKALDYLNRTKRVGRNAVLINFSGETEDFANCVVQLNDNMSLKVSEIINFNREYIVATETNIESFFKGYYDDLGLSIMPKIKVSETEEINAVKIKVEDSGTSQSSSGDGGGTSPTAGGGQGKELYFTNDGTTSVFRDGKKFAEITPDDVKYINLMQPDNVLGTFVLNNVNSDLFKDARVVLDLTNKEMGYKLSFKDGKPKITYSIDLYIVLDEIIESEKTENLLHTENWFVDKSVINGLTNKVKENLNIVVNKLKDKNIDMIEVYDKFYKFKNKKFIKFLNTFENKQDFLKDVIFDYKITIHSSY